MIRSAVFIFALTTQAIAAEPPLWVLIGLDSHMARQPYAMRLRNSSPTCRCPAQDVVVSSPPARNLVLSRIMGILKIAAGGDAAELGITSRPSPSRHKSAGCFPGPP
jgi:hypothetical protein